jgi:signal transduction histidine kinase
VKRLRQIGAWLIQLTGFAALLGAIFVLVLLGFGRFPRGSEWTLLGLAFAGAAAAAGLAAPLRRRLAEAADRVRYGGRAAPEELVERLRSRFSRAVPLEELLLEVVEVLREGLRLSAAEVWMGGRDGLERVVSDPERPRDRFDLEPAARDVVGRAGVSGGAWARVWLPGLAGERDAAFLVAPVTHSGELHGLLVAERAPAGLSFGAEDERVLRDVSRQLGLALHNLRLDSALQETLEELRRQAEELRASRARVVAAADAERRRIERDLHDGAQQRLVALAVKLRLARELAGAAAAPHLDELAADLERTLDELRDLAHGIYPPLLADRGLGEALPAAAARAALPARVEVSANGRYPPDVESAVYFCCLEALQNASKHAGAGATATVRLWQESDRLRFEVADDGAGFEPSATREGTGLANMRDRLGAVGGSLEISSAHGEGTSLVGTVPLA